MIPQDLRIGNYVRIKDNGTIVQVCAIAQEKVYLEGKNGRFCRDYSEIEPVRISEVYSLLHFSDELKSCGRKDIYIYFYKGIPIADIHDIQNIHYALTGYEIKIEI